MSEFWQEFKNGGISAVGVFGALFIMLAMIIWAIILIVGLQLVLWSAWLCRHYLDSYSVIQHLRLQNVDFLVSITDSYLLWYEKITSSIKNLVK